MIAGVPLLPAILLDIIGSAANIVLAFLSWRYALLLSRRQPDNFVWGYLFYVTFAIAAFTISRAVGHLIKQFLLIAGQADLWREISPYSGGFNTLFMISVAAVMIFYHKGVQAYEALEHEAGKLKNANRELAAAAVQLRDLNQTLEQKVEERTEELSQSEKKFRHLFSASKDMVFFSDAGNRVVDMNDSGFEMLGYCREETSTLQLADIFLNPDEIDTFITRLSRDGYIKDLNVDLARRDGKIVSVLLSATAIIGERGEVQGSEVIAKDLTRLKTMMEQLASSEKMASVGQIAAGVAHEINTPLGIILGYSQLLMDDVQEDSDAYQSLKVIERQTKASRKIVADLLKFSRQSGSTREEVDLNEILADVVAVTEHTLGLSNIAIHRQMANDLPGVDGDPEKLRQVFVNLVNNAHHAMLAQGGGELLLRTRIDNGDVMVEVRDSGHGIPERYLARIFDPFFTTKPVGQGTGLGLSVSYGIIHEHGGTIEVESPVLDQQQGALPGTLFRIRLPRSGADRRQMTDMSGARA
ncbi:MAG: ATP-binding protein [Desulfoprunum sp.]|jgi:PAS domain S-box-containing protein|uniref:two-component system sensor histidine kinase NtrB n=1 Tax=Desulfoprunum sp. TaxID=2020866 RepID=UPI000AE49F03